jgi:hypothetical protein
MYNQHPHHWDICFQFYPLLTFMLILLKTVTRLAVSEPLPANHLFLPHTLRQRRTPVSFASSVSLSVFSSITISTTT